MSWTLMHTNTAPQSLWLQRLLKHMLAGEESRDEENRESGVLVIDDPRSESPEILEQALSLRRQHPGLPIAILTLIDSHRPDTDLGACMSGRAPAAGSTISQGRFFHDMAQATNAPTYGCLDREVVTFEYQGCKSN